MIDLKIGIVAQDDDFVVIDKPAGLASAPLSADGSDNAFAQIVRLFPAAAGFCGKKSIEGGLVHRLDTATRGLLLAALNKRAFDAFEAQQKNGAFVKYYRAYCHALGFSVKNKPPFYIESRFRPYGAGRKRVKPVFDNSGKADLKKAAGTVYRTEVLCIEEPSESERKRFFTHDLRSNGSAEVQPTEVPPMLRVHCRIRRGYRHQVRAHLAWALMPVIGDFLYNPLFSVQAEDSIKNGKTGSLAGYEKASAVLGQTELCFFAYALEFKHPASGKPLHFEIDI